MLSFTLFELKGSISSRPTSFFVHLSQLWQFHILHLWLDKLPNFCHTILVSWNHIRSKQLCNDCKAEPTMTKKHYIALAKAFHQMYQQIKETEKAGFRHAVDVFMTEAEKAFPNFKPKFFMKAVYDNNQNWTYPILLSDLQKIQLSLLGAKPAQPLYRQPYPIPYHRGSRLMHPEYLTATTFIITCLILIAIIAKL